jgi:PAS domain S-box-containing protein
MICAAPCLVVLVMVAFGSLGYRQIMRDNAMAESADRMDDLAVRVKNFFDGATLLSRFIASRQKAIGAGPTANTRPILRSLLEEMQPYEAQGVYIAFEDRPYTDIDAIQWVWREPVAGKDAYIYHETDRLAYDYHLLGEHTEWYQGAKAQKEGEFYITRPFFDRDNTNTWMVSVTRPIFVPEGAGSRFIGVAGVDLRLKDLTAHLQSRVGGELERKDRGGYFYLYSQGLVYALPDPVLAGLKTTADAHRLDEVRELLPEVDEVAAEDTGQLVKVAPAGGHRRLVSWKRISKEFGDKIVLSFPWEGVYGPASRATWASVGIGLVALAVMIGVVTTVAEHFLTRPIKRLTAAAEAVETGDYQPNGLGSLATRHDEFGQLARGFRGMVKEVSARARPLRDALGELARSERHYRALFENAMDVISVIGPHGDMRYQSPSVERVLGHKPDELMGRQVGTLVHPDDRAKLAAHFRELDGRPGRELTTELRFQHKDGSWRTLEASCTNLTDDPAVLGIVVNSRDITERKRSEDAIRQLNASLDHRVRLRTAELQQAVEELHAAKESAEFATKQMEEFAAGVAHDMRNLLMIIIGYGEDLLRRATKKNISEFVPDLKLIANKGNELIELLNDLLCQSKAMSGKGVVLDLDEFDVAAMVQARMEGIELIAQKNGNKVSFQAGDGLGIMFADEVKVRRILMNLLTNACKFTHNGEITLRAQREPAGADAGADVGDRIIFQVTDTGIGMSPAQIAKLFDRFAQVHDRKAQGGTGFGLGLANCLLYCKAMGGEITVQSEVGQGTSFVVKLPAVVSIDGLPAVAGPPRDNATATNPGRGDSANLILIIDDDASINELMQRNLGEEGFQTLAALSGEEGLRLAKLTLPSAIILDVVMPGIDGWAVLAALKTDAQTANIPIIVASMLDERERGIQMGAFAYLTKPFTRDRMSGLLHKQLGGRRPARILIVGDDAIVRDRFCDLHLGANQEVVTATDTESALAILRADPPDLMLVDLPLDRGRGGDLIEKVRQNPAWNLIPIIVTSSAELGAEDRRNLQARLEEVLERGLCDREQMFNEIGTVIEQFRQRVPSLSQGAADA